MADQMDELIEHLLDQIALSTTKGFTAVDFEEAILCFYQHKNVFIHDVEDKFTVDEELINSAYERLSEHEDVKINEFEQDDQTSADQDDDHPTELQSKLAGKRILTSEDRLWQTITGHECDLTRVPSMEWELLVVIAQHGPKGVLQGTAREETGQDKHSVPARTDRLAQKGYITKSTVMAHGTRTSLLRLSRWAEDDASSVVDEVVIHYDSMFDTTVSLLKENGNIIAMDDLCKGLGLERKGMRRLLIGCLVSLSRVECVRLLRCRVQDEDGNPVMLKRGKGEMTTRAIQLLREPTDEDRSAFSSRSRRESDRRNSDSPAESIEGDFDDDESLEDEEAENDDEDAEGETESDQVDSPASGSRSRRGTNSGMPPPDTLTPSRRSTRVRRQSSLAKGVDYARLFEDEEDDSDQDAEFEVTESASPETLRRPIVNFSAEMAQTTTPPSKKKQSRQKRSAGVKSLNKSGSKRGRPRHSPAVGFDELGGESAGFSMFETTPIEPTRSAFGVSGRISTRPASAQRERKKSAKAIEADALRAAGEPLLTEPVDGYDMDVDSDDDSEEEGQENLDSDGMELDAGKSNKTPAAEKTKKKRQPVPRDENGVKIKKPREPVVKKREVPPEEYEEYDKYALAAARRQVRLEMKTGIKRTAIMAELDDTAESSNKAARTEAPGDAAEEPTNNLEAPFEPSDKAVPIDDQNDGENSNAEKPADDLPADRVAEVKASIIARSKPGVYINPPGARNLKLETYIQRGRPRNALIAVVKSDRLKDLLWFQDDSKPRFAPKASRRRTARIGEGVRRWKIDKSAFFVEGSGSEGEGEVRKKKKRKLVGESSFRVANRKQMKAPTEQQPGSFGMLKFGGDGARDDDDDNDEADEDEEIQYEDEVQGETPVENTTLRRTSRISKRPSTGFNMAPIADDWSPERSFSPSVDEEESTQGSPVPEDPIVAAKKELGVLQNKRGRPRKDDITRIKVLQRQIEIAAAAAREKELDDADVFASTGGGSGSLSSLQQAANPTPAVETVAGAQVSAAQIAALPEKFPFEKRDMPEPGVPAPADAEVATPALETSGIGNAVQSSVGELPIAAIYTQSQHTAVENGKSAQPVPSAHAQATTPAIPKTAAQTELDTLLAIRPKDRTTKERIKVLKTQVDDAFINSPGTLEELRTLQAKKGRPTALLYSRRAALMKQFPDAGKISAEERASFHAQMDAGENIEKEDGGAVGQNEEPVVAGPSTATTAVPHGLPTTKTPVPSGVEDGKLQTYQNTMVNVQAAPAFLGGLDAHPTTPAANTEAIRATDRRSQKQPVLSSLATATATEAKPTGPAVQPAVVPATPAFKELFTKQYVDQHPDEKFHYRGGGRWARGERFSKMYVMLHPDEKFYRVEGEGNVVRFARGSPPPALEAPPGGNGVDAARAEVEREVVQPGTEPQVAASDPTEQPQAEPEIDRGTLPTSVEPKIMTTIPTELTEPHSERESMRIAPNQQEVVPDPAPAEQTQPEIEPESVQSASQEAVPNPTKPPRSTRPDNEPHISPITSIEQYNASIVTEQSQPKVMPQVASATVDEQRTATASNEQSSPVVDVDSPGPLQDDIVPETSARSRRASTRTGNAELQKKKAEVPEERFDKAYVTAHPGEHFYHRGKGQYSRGEPVSKEYVDAHPEEKFKTVQRRYIRLPDVQRARTPPPPSEKPAVRLNQQLQSATSFNGVYKMYDKEYVDSHPEETFYHRGGGRWHPGFPPPGSTFRTAVRGPGAEEWKSKAMNPVAAPITTPAATPVSTAVPVPAPTEQVATASTPMPAPSVPVLAPVATPLSSLLTIYKPYSPQTIANPPSVPAMVNKENSPEDRMVEPQPTVVEEMNDLEMVDTSLEKQDHERVSTPSPNMEEDITMVDHADDDQSVPLNHMDEDAGNEPSISHIEADNAVVASRSLSPHVQQTQLDPAQKTFFQVDLTAAVVVRRTPKQKEQLEKQRQAKEHQARDEQTKQKQAEQVKSNSNDEVDLTGPDDLQVVTKRSPPARKPVKPARAPARGSKASRDMRLKAQHFRSNGVPSKFGMADRASALLMHPVQSFHPATGTFATSLETAPPESDGRRTLRDRTTLTRLPQALDDDFCETPGLIVKLKVRNLASVLPPDTAFESGRLFDTNAASDAVPISRITRKAVRPYNRRSKQVTFQVDSSDGDEFRDEGGVEDDDDVSDDEFNTSEEEGDTAVARPERRKRSTGANGEIRIRDMVSGPAFKDADRLVIAFALVAAVCGGLRVEGISWTLIAHALGFRYDGAFLRRRWDHYKRTRKVDVDRLREAIHEPFLAAYEGDDFPRVDFQNLNNTDWPALLDWVQATVVPNVQLQPKVEGPKVPNLLPSRDETEERFEIKEPANTFEIRLDDYFTTLTEQSRRNLVTNYTYGIALPGELRPKDHVAQNMTLLRSWVRAVAVTKQYNYHIDAATRKIQKFGVGPLQQVTQEMVESHTFSQERKNRMLPGRNYHISNECLQNFRRWPARPDECRFLRFVAQAWKNINLHFQTSDELSLVPSASDPEYLVLTNLVAQGMIRINTMYPEIKNDYDAPYPKLSPWGYCGPTYETKKVDMNRLKFPIVYTKTAAYKDDHELLNNVPIPLHPPQLDDELGLRTPFWVDIHGNLIDDIWDMVLRSILHLLVFRAGTTANMIEQAHGRKLWAWEIDMALKWMGEVGIAKRVGQGTVRDDGVWSGGWRAGEWWYCAFSPEVARWKAPAVAELS